jgi:hypothetical protein
MNIQAQTLNPFLIARQPAILTALLKTSTGPSSLL